MYCKNDSKDNCGKDRKSLESYDSPVKEVMALTCDCLPLADVTTILGPATYNEWAIGDGKVIGVFGEYHGIPVDRIGKIDNSTTLLFPNFLKVLLSTNKSTQYDLFIEKLYSHGELDDFMVDPQSTIFNILDIDFQSCLTFVKNCKYKNLRAHSIDYGRENDQWFSKMYQDIYFGTSNIADYTELFNIQEEYSKSYDTVLHIINTDVKIKKQLSATPLHTSIINYIKGSLLISRLKFLLFLEGKHTETLSMLSPKIKTYREFKLSLLKGEDTFDYKTELITHFVKLYSYIMDIYTLGRIFRTYKDSTFATRSIVYVGLEHAIVYNNFMKHMKYAKIIEIGDPDKISHMVTFTPSKLKKSFLFN